MKMTWSLKRRETLADDLDLLLGDLCINLGFCNHLTGETLLRKHAPLTASDFAGDVLYAEGLESRYSLFRAAIEQAFLARYGNAVSSQDYNPGIPVSLNFPDSPEP